MRFAVLLLAAGMLAGVPTQSLCAAERVFAMGIAGSNPSDTRYQARRYFQKPEVRRLVERLETGPLQADEIVGALAGSGTSLDDLVRTKIVRETGTGYRIGFNYFTLADMRRIHATAEEFVPSLVAAYRSHQGEFDRIFSRYPIKTVDRKALATVVLAGFALNWDALATSKDDGFRVPDMVVGDGWKYSFWAAEDDPAYSTKGFVWGSSTLFGSGDNFAERPVDFVFSSFGDPDSDPRMNFPDLFYLPSGDLTPTVRHAVQSVGLRDENYAGFPIEAALGVSRARSIGPMLFALRRKPLRPGELAGFAQPSDRAQATHLIALLVASRYISLRPDGRYALLQPVFDASDAAMLNDALALHRRIFSSWLAETFPKAKARLGTITAIRQGVAFESAFTQIWHDYFGLATRQLASAGMIADLNDPASGYAGSIPVLWRRSIYKLDLG